MAATLLRQGLGRAHRRHAAERADAAVHRPAPHPRGDEPAGVRDAARARARRARCRSARSRTVDHIVPTRDQRRPFLDVMAEDMLSAIERNCREHGHHAVRPGQRPAGDRPRDRAGAGADAAGDDDRLRRQPHLHARRVRRDRLRHRHVAGARRARVAVPGDRAAEGAPHRRQRPTRAAASTRRT